MSAVCRSSQASAVCRSSQVSAVCRSSQVSAVCRSSQASAVCRSSQVCLQCVGLVKRLQCVGLVKRLQCVGLVKCASYKCCLCVFQTVSLPVCRQVSPFTLSSVDYLAAAGVSINSQDSAIIYQVLSVNPSSNDFYSRSDLGGRRLVHLF